MARAEGRIYLKTDGGARDVDRLVARETSATFYPTSTTSDQAVTVTFVYLEATNETVIHVEQNQRQNGARVLYEGRVSNAAPTPDQAQTEPASV